MEKHRNGMTECRLSGGAFGDVSYAYGVMSLLGSETFVWVKGVFEVSKVRHPYGKPSAEPTPHYAARMVILARQNGVVTKYTFTETVWHTDHTDLFLRVLPVGIDWQKSTLFCRTCRADFVGCRVEVDYEEKPATAQDRDGFESLEREQPAPVASAQIGVCAVCGWIHTADGTRWENPHTKESVLFKHGSDRAVFLVGLCDGMRIDGESTSYARAQGCEKSLTPKRPKDILGRHTGTFFESTGRGQGRIAPPKLRTKKAK